MLAPLLSAYLPLSDFRCSQNWHSRKRNAGGNIVWILLISLIVQRPRFSSKTYPRMHQLYFITLAALTLDLSWGQVPYSYLPEDIPNPQKNPGACGLGKTRGYICDPNRILSKKQLEAIDWHLKGIAEIKNLETCPCSRYFCEHSSMPFYKVSIALIPKLRLTLGTDGRKTSPLHQAEQVAYRLEHDLWNISTCEQDIVILYSRDDQVLVTMTGSSAGRRLNAYTRRVLHSLVGQHFADGKIKEGMLRLVYELNLVLNGKTHYTGAMLAQTTGSGSHFSASPLTLSILAASSVFTLWFLRSS